MSQENRVETMATKLAVYATRAGVPPDHIVDAYHAALTPRIRELADVFHPDMLHPARTALILLEDTDIRDASVLTASVLAETEYPRMRLPIETIEGSFGGRIAQLVNAVPIPASLESEELLEALVNLPDDVACVAVAERLDHARHLRFRDASVWAGFFEQIRDVYLPFANRVSEPLALRLARWQQSFEARHLS